MWKREVNNKEKGGRRDLVPLFSQIRKTQQSGEKVEKKQVVQFGV